MNAPIYRVRAVIAAIALVFLLGSCSRVFFIKPVGKIGQQIAFRFHDAFDDDTPSEHNIVWFSVQVQKSDGAWTYVWELKGEQPLDSITYGAKYDRLKEMIPAVPLVQAAHYRVVAGDSKGRTFLPPSPPTPGSAEALFFIDEGGQVVVELPHG